MKVRSDLWDPESGGVHFLARITGDPKKSGDVVSWCFAFAAAMWF